MRHSAVMRAKTMMCRLLFITAIIEPGYRLNVGCGLFPRCDGYADITRLHVQKQGRQKTRAMVDDAQAVSDRQACPSGTDMVESQNTLRKCHE
ncbi:hypothetical protein FACS1894206_07760 [Deltaproteobacteria bacterium]|nr:hypothetical protein FACS1894206_07760 [Deltaproteobacteria bacterium]